MPFAAALPILGGIAKSIFGASSASKDRKANLRATRETNDLNRHINNQALARDAAKFSIARSDNRRRIRDTVNDALQAGINPLTALGTAGAGGVSHAGAPGLIGAVAPPPLSSRNHAGEAIDTIFNSLDPIQKEKEQLELGLMRAKLDQVQKQTAVVRDRNFGYSIPHTTNLTGEDHAGNTKHTRSNTDRVSTDTDDTLYYDGVIVEDDPATSHADKAEQRYSDLVGNFWGVKKALDDIVLTRRMKLRQQGRGFGPNTRPNNQPPKIHRGPSRRPRNSPDYDWNQWLPFVGSPRTKRS